MIDGFTFFKSYYKALSKLSKKDKLDVLNAIIDYVFEDKEPKFSGKKELVWILIEPNLSKSKNKSKNARKKTKQNQIKIKINSKTYLIKITRLLYPYPTPNNNILYKYVLVKRGYGGKKPFVEDCFSFCEKEFGRTLSPSEYNQLAYWRDNWFDDEIINLALKKTSLAGVRALAYTEKIINSWHDKGYKTYKECASENFKSNQTENKKIVKEVEELENYDWLNED